MLRWDLRRSQGLAQRESLRPEGQRNATFVVQDSIQHRCLVSAPAAQRARFSLRRARQTALVVPQGAFVRALAWLRSQISVSQEPLAL